MKKILPVLRPVVLLVIGIVMAILSAIVQTVSPNVGQDNIVAAANLIQTGVPSTATPTGGISVAGSTDGIVLMGILIVLIVVVPIIVRRKTWAK